MESVKGSVYVCVGVVELSVQDQEVLCYRFKVLQHDGNEYIQHKQKADDCVTPHASTNDGDRTQNSKSRRAIKMHQQSR